MGRHRRSAAGRAATGGRATEVTQKHQISTEDYGPENLYGFAAVLEADRLATRSHRRKKAATPVRTGLLGVSAAVALGTVAVAAGVLPGAKQFTVSGDAGGPQAGGAAPSGFATEQGGTSGSADDRGSTSTSRDDDRAAAPTTPPPSTSAAPSAPAEEPSKAPAPTATKTATAAPPVQQETTEPQTTPPAKVTAEGAAAVAVLKLVNDERAKVGCSPVTPNGPLKKLAEGFSEAMAAQGFFDHTDPSGQDPWDRAAALGITDLGGENIARGQATAQDVMVAWMNSPGHRANILNCDFQTLGVGVHFGDGGPWWTQDFGY